MWDEHGQPACGRLSLGRGEQLLQQAWTPPALGAPPAHDLHQALPFPSHPVSERLFPKLAERRGMRLLCQGPCERQRRAPVRRRAGGPLFRRSPEECADWELLLEDPCLSPRSYGAVSGGHWPPGAASQPLWKERERPELHFRDESLCLFLEVRGERARRKLENAGHALVSVTFNLI